MILHDNRQAQQHTAPRKAYVPFCELLRRNITIKGEAHQVDHIPLLTERPQGLLLFAFPFGRRNMFGPQLLYVFGTCSRRDYPDPHPVAAVLYRDQRRVDQNLAYLRRLISKVSEKGSTLCAGKYIQVVLLRNLRSPCPHGTVALATADYAPGITATIADMSVGCFGGSSPNIGQPPHSAFDNRRPRVRTMITAAANALAGYFVGYSPNYHQPPSIIDSAQMKLGKGRSATFGRQHTIQYTNIQDAHQETGKLVQAGIHI